MGVTVIRPRAALPAAVLLSLLSSAADALAVPVRAPAALPTGPSPVAFAIEPVPGTWQWRWSLRNVSGAPVEVATDRRLVWFEAQTPADPRVRRRRVAPVRCVFEARPTSTDRAVATELQAGERYSELVDLRDVCRLRVPAAMAPGALVMAHYGFEPVASTGRRASRARWMARTIALDGRAYPVNDLTAMVAVPSGGDVERAVAVSGLTLAGRGAQAATGMGLRASVRVQNSSGRPLWTLFRNVLFSFYVTTPQGRAVACEAITREPSPFREFFVRLGPGGGRGAVLAPYDYCPLGTFDAAGLYSARAGFSTRANGDPWRQGAVFTGRAASAPFVFRIARGDGRYRPQGLEVSR